MSYDIVLKKAGYKIAAYECFGSDAGNWAAVLTNGRVIIGPYGSCVGCDALEGYLDYSKKVEDITKDECILFLRDYGIAASKDYNSIISKYKWGCDSNEMLNWVLMILAQLGFIKPGQYKLEV